MAGSKMSRIAGWVLTVLVALFLIVASGVPKFVDWEGKDEMFQKMGFTVEIMWYIGIVEVAVTILYVLPRTSFLGAILLTAYLGGAVVTHVRVEDAFFFPIIIGVVAWVALGLRRPEIFALAIGSGSSSEKTT